VAGVFAGHSVVVAVDSDGMEVYSVDGTKTYEGRFCNDATHVSCPSSLTVLDRNPDKSVSFMMSECFSPTYHVCVTTQENWDYEKSHGQ